MIRVRKKIRGLKHLVPNESCEKVIGQAEMIEKLTTVYNFHVSNLDGRKGSLFYPLILLYQLLKA